MGWGGTATGAFTSLARLLEFRLQWVDSLWRGEERTVVARIETVSLDNYFSLSQLEFLGRFHNLRELKLSCSGALFEPLEQASAQSNSLLLQGLGSVMCSGHRMLRTQGEAARGVCVCWSCQILRCCPSLTRLFIDTDTIAVNQLRFDSLPCVDALGHHLGPSSVLVFTARTLKCQRPNLGRPIAAGERT